MSPELEQHTAQAELRLAQGWIEFEGPAVTCHGVVELRQVDRTTFEVGTAFRFRQPAVEAKVVNHLRVYIGPYYPHDVIAGWSSAQQ